MSKAARVIGVGQTAAGDDGVGLVVVRALRGASPEAPAELFEVAEPSAMVEHLRTPGRVVIVDAIVGAGSPGELVKLDADVLGAEAERLVSTHGVDVPQAISLARTLYPEGVSPDIRILAVCIVPPSAYVHGLSEAVSAAVPHAVGAVLAMLMEN